MDSRCHRQRLVAGKLSTDLIRNLKSTNHRLRVEKESAVSDLKHLQCSVRATQMTEVTRQNTMLLEEVDRLRQMNSVLKQQLAAKEESCAAQLAPLRAELEQQKPQQKACMCLSSQYDSWNRDGWGYDEESTAKQLLSRSRCAYDAIFQALRFCVESSAGTNSGGSGISKNQVDVQIRALMDFLSTQGSRAQNEMIIITGQPDPSRVGNASVKAAVKFKAPKPRPRARAKDLPAALADHMDSACLAVSTAVEGLKSVSQDRFSTSASMRASARSLGAVMMTFVKLHQRLEPSLKSAGPASSVQASHGLSTLQPVPSDPEPGAAVQHSVQMLSAPAVSHPKISVSGFFGAASLQSHGSGVSDTGQTAASGSHAAESLAHGQGEAADPTLRHMSGDQDASKVCSDSKGGDQDAQADSCDPAASADVEGGGAVSPQPVDPDTTQQDNSPGTQSRSDVEGLAPVVSMQPSTMADSLHYTESSSSTEFSDELDPESSLLLPDSELSSRQKPPASHSSTLPLGLDSSACEVTLDTGHGASATASRVIESASARSDQEASATGDAPFSKQNSCSGRSAQDCVGPTSTNPETSTSDSITRHSDYRGESSTEYSYSGTDTHLHPF